MHSTIHTEYSMYKEFFIPYACCMSLITIYSCFFCCLAVPTQYFL